MKLPVVLLSLLVLAGCAGNKSADPSSLWQTQRSFPANPPPARPPASKPIVTPGSAVSGVVKSVNSTRTFVVINFPIGALPPSGRQLSVYRGGLKVAEVRTGDMKIDFNIVADIVAGECRVGDEVKDY